MFTAATIVEIKNLSKRVKEFTLETDVAITSIPGQFIVLKWGENERSYSISAQLKPNSIQIIVALNDNGIVSPRLFDLQVGDKLEISEAKGTFVLPDKIEQSTLCFICTGTGLAPFKYMIHDLLTKQNWQGNIHLIFGNRTQDDILYHHEIMKLEKLNANFTYSPVLSQENWSGLKGYVHQVYLNTYSSQDSVLFYVCGWQVMCNETRKNLKELGFTRKQYKFEQYD